MKQSKKTEKVHECAALLQQALSLHQAGRLDEAYQFYKKILRIDSKNFDALQFSAILKGQTGNQTEALELFDQALQLNRTNAAVFTNRGLTLQKLRRFDEALESYVEAIRLNPDNPDVFNNQGIALKELKRYDEALNSYAEAIRLKPDYSDAFYNLGNALKELKRYDDALASYVEALRIKPDDAEVLNNRGMTLHKLNRFHDALESYAEAIRLKPELAEAFNNQGMTLEELTRFGDSLESYAEAIRLKPEYAEAFNNRGITLQELKRYEDALASYAEALRIKPDFAEVFNNRGNTLKELNRFDDALASYAEALRIKPNYAGVFYNQGNALTELKRYEEALASYERAIELKPDGDFFLGNLVNIQMLICDWTKLEHRLQSLRAGIIDGNKVIVPFSVLGLFDIPRLQRQCAEIYAKKKLNQTSQLGVAAKKARGEKIRIGYFSPDFLEHPVSYLIADLIENHDRHRFEIYGFSIGIDTKDPMRQRLEKAFDRFLDVKNLCELDITRLARSQAIDIAVDLGGYTKDSRPQIFAERAAPIQINYLGYPGTLGANCMDYFIGDRVTITDENREHFSEKIIYMPNSFQPIPSQRPIGTDELLRQAYGLPEKGFVFCCFNNTWKITPDVFESWVRILDNVEDSVFWLKRTDLTAKKNILEAFEANNINLSRIVFAERLPSISDHLSRYQRADLFLNTFPFGAHTTASDALWAGLPVLTRSGKSFASRVSASLLKNVGISELITNSSDEYESSAIELATNPVKLAHIKARLASNRSTTPLFDTPLYTRHIESAYTAAYDRYHAGLPPDHIYVDPY